MKPTRHLARKTLRHRIENTVKDVVSVLLMKSICQRVRSCDRHREVEKEKGKSRKSLTYGYLRLARATGLEPATTGSTVRYSNQLSYAPMFVVSV